LYGLTTQYIGKTYQMFQLSATGITYVISLNCHWSVIWLTTVCWMLD